MIESVCSRWCNPADGAIHPFVLLFLLRFWSNADPCWRVHAFLSSIGIRLFSLFCEIFSWKVFVLSCIHFLLERTGQGCRLSFPSRSFTSMKKQMCPDSDGILMTAHRHHHPIKISFRTHSNKKRWDRKGWTRRKSNQILLLVYSKRWSAIIVSFPPSIPPSFDPSFLHPDNHPLFSWRQQKEDPKSVRY